MIKYLLAIGFISTLVLAVIIYIFVTKGTPGTIRAEKFDQTRQQDISRLKGSIENYYFKNKKLPNSVADLAEGSSSVKKDPETNNDYVYVPGEDLNYQLCATFNLESKETENSRYQNYYDQEFKHPKGYHCFDLKVQKATANVSYSYSDYVSSMESPDKRSKSKVAQTFKVDKNRSVKGLKSKFDFENPYVVKVHGDHTVVLREFVNEKDLEAGTLLASGKVSDIALAQLNEQNILFNTSVNLVPNKQYVLIFEAAGNTTMNLLVSKQGPDPSGNVYLFTFSNVPNSDPDKFVWNKQEKWDIYYELIS